jgi:hypothetical protein|tara:strand:+ start:26849 stop:26992 length:144 start_codon:yes stop_codon:yes gene_type:complete
MITPTDEEITLELNTELFRDHPELKPKDKSGLNYWINTANPKEVKKK